MTARPPTLVVIPTYDEAGNIRTVLDRVLRAAPDVDVLVVDDDSPDGTAGLVTEHPAAGATGLPALADGEGRPGRGVPGRVRAGPSTRATTSWSRWTPT